MTLLWRVDLGEYTDTGIKPIRAQVYLTEQEALDASENLVWDGPGPDRKVSISTIPSEKRSATAVWDGRTLTLCDGPEGEGAESWAVTIYSAGIVHVHGRIRPDGQLNRFAPIPNAMAVMLGRLCDKDVRPRVIRHA